MLMAIPAAITVAGKGYDIAKGVIAGVQHLFNGGSQDVMSKVWKDIPPEAAFYFNAVKQGDGWHDIQTGVKLSQEESDKRVTAIIAGYVGAVRGADGYWRDKVTGQPLTSQDALNRWNGTYGNGARPVQVLQRPSQYVSGNTTNNVPTTTGQQIADYINDQGKAIVKAAQGAGTNIETVAVNAGNAATTAAKATVVAQQQADTIRKVMYVALGIVGVLAVVYLLKKRG